MVANGDAGQQEGCTGFLASVLPAGDQELVGMSPPVWAGDGFEGSLTHLSQDRIQGCSRSSEALGRRAGSLASAAWMKLFAPRDIQRSYLEGMEGGRIQERTGGEGNACTGPSWFEDARPYAGSWFTAESRRKREPLSHKTYRGSRSKMLMQTFSRDSSSNGALPTSSSYASTPTAQLSTCGDMGREQEVKHGGGGGAESAELWGCALDDQ